MKLLRSQPDLLNYIGVVKQKALFKFNGLDGESARPWYCLARSETKRSLSFLIKIHKKTASAMSHILYKYSIALFVS